MKIEHEKKESLAEAVNLIERLIGENGLVLSPELEGKIKALKIEAGLLVDTSIDFIGVNDGCYRFRAVRSDGITKIFDINPDDVEIYNLCLQAALETDKKDVMRERRLKEYDRYINSIKKPQSSTNISSVDKAIEKLNYIANENTSVSSGLKIKRIGEKTFNDR